MTYVPLSIKWRDEIAHAETLINELMQAKGFPILDANEEHWRAAFGDAEHELREQEEALAQRIASLSWRQRKERDQTIRAYIHVRAMLTVPFGLRTRW